MTRHEDERSAAVVVITVITPGRTDSVAKAPSAVVRLSDKDVDAIKRARGLDVLQFLKAAIEVEVEVCYDSIEDSDQEQKTVLKLSGDMRVVDLDSGGNAIYDEETDKHTLGDEHTPADHFFRS
jgi:hypothetical protein